MNGSKKQKREFPRGKDIVMTIETPRFGAVMEFTGFHNALRVLMSIDQDEFTQAIWPEHDGSPPSVGSGMHIEWLSFRVDPHRWFIRAPAPKATAIWQLMQTRMKL